MKKFLLPLVLVIVTGQIFAVNELYCTPTGAGFADGSSFSNAATPTGIMNLLAAGPNVSGDVKIHFGRGHYYFDFHFLSSNIQTTITSISLYGGFHESINFIFDSSDYINRDFYADETVFHSQTDPLIIYYCPWLTNATNVIDGITFVSDNSMFVAAMELYNGDHLISHCRIKDYKTTTPLLWLENGNSYKCILNSVIEDNTASCLLSAYCDLDIVNTTIADNIFYDDLIYENLSHHTYTIFNSIIWGCMNYSMASINRYVHVANSIVEHYDSSWMGDDGYNFWNVDPQFSYTYPDPHTCCTTSVALDNGYDGYLTALSFGLNTAYPYAYYEFNMHPRFFEDIFSVSSPWMVDIGAYQHFYKYQDSYYYPTQSAPRRQYQNEEEQASLESDRILPYNILGQPVDDTYHGIVIRNGQKVLQ